MSTECKCLNPESGGTKCPAQHIAICIRGRDGECYGECVPIPNDFQEVSQRFYNWMQKSIIDKVAEHIIDNTFVDGVNLSKENVFKFFEISETLTDITDYESTFQGYNIGGLQVRFSYSFNNENLRFQ